MRTLTLTSEISPSRVCFNRDIFPRDLKGTVPTLVSGEWCLYLDEQRKKTYLGYYNPHVSGAPTGRILCEFAGMVKADEAALEVAWKEVESLLLTAIKRKSQFENYKEGYRLCHGASDELTGLVIDVYQNMVLIQINTAGMDRLRENIKKRMNEIFAQKKVVFLDQENYRKAELLPIYPAEELSDLEVRENGFSYLIPKDVLQKVGFYYDHRENREKMERKIKCAHKKFSKGMDLFCYAGGWGLHLLRAGVEKVTLVDQGNLSSVVNENLRRNGYADRGEFVRADVFDYLDKLKVEGKTFDVIVSDPPAFKKNEKNKNAALVGYEKLHTKALSLLENESLFAACSCTHNISLEELDRTVQTAALKERKKVFMLDVGIQGMDHSFSSFQDKGHYLKYILYWVENL